MIQRLHDLLDGSYEEMVSIRRYLHQHPELSFQKPKRRPSSLDIMKNLESNTGRM